MTALKVDGSAVTQFTGRINTQGPTAALTNQWETLILVSTGPGDALDTGNLRVGQSRIAEWRRDFGKAAGAGYDCQIFGADQVEPKNAKRVQASKAAAAKRAKQLIDYVEGLTIEVPELADEVLLRRAIENYNDLHVDHGKCASSSDSPEFLDRICVSYLRHCCTQYEAELDNLFGEVGVDDAVTALRERISDAIAMEYPALAAECAQQMLARSSR